MAKTVQSFVSTRRRRARGNDGECSSSVPAYRGCERLRCAVGVQVSNAAAAPVTTQRQCSNLSASLSARNAVRLPRHLAIIMDGNRRWASQRRLPHRLGHRAGARNVRPVVEACANLGIRCLTLFAFSTENFQRPQQEVTLLMSLIRGFLENDLDELRRREVRLRIIGDRARFPADLQFQMNRAESATRGNTELTLNVAAGYGGRWDIVQAARAVTEAILNDRLSPDYIDEAVFGSFLSLASLPTPDFCIRTGGERRISNFLLWDFAYTELYFTDTYWPDFDKGELVAAIDAYAKRRRRFGTRERPA